MLARPRRRAAGVSATARASELGLERPTLPSVTVRSISITESLVSRSGVSSSKPMTTCTIFVMACRSCPCFLESCRTCSFRSRQSLADRHMATMARSSRVVDARSDACSRRRQPRSVPEEGSSDFRLPDETASRARAAFRSPPVRRSSRRSATVRARCGCSRGYFGKLLSFWDLLLNLLGEISVRFDDASVGHGVGASVRSERDGWKDRPSCSPSACRRVHATEPFELRDAAGAGLR